MPSHWARVNDLFHRALEQPAAARPAFLDATCAGDEALRREVVSLLAANERAGDFIEQPTLSAADLLDQSLAEGGALVGREMGQYRVERVLGEGGMGVVYLAEDTRLGRLVALKALAPRFTKDPARRERLAREARAAAGLTHPGIATVYALEEFDDHLYIACEYVPGDTLRKELEHGPLPLPRVVDTAISIARALAVAHDRGIVHRDLKPENIIRTPGGDLKILDFGLARFRDPAVGPALTGDGTILGTPAYMSPEQIRGRAVDFRSDLFSLGIVVYELATGVHPFANGDAASTIARILETEPTSLRGQASNRVSPDVSLGHLDAIVLTCLRKPPDARYRSTHELIAALELARSAVSNWTPGATSASLGPRRSDTAAATRSPRWWWEFHQTTASATYCALLAPLWLVHEWFPGVSGMALFLAGLAAATAATILRMHRVFTVRSYPEEREAQLRSTGPWLRLADAAFAVALLAGSVFVITLHASVAIILVGAAVAVILSSTVIEPATTRAAFPASPGAR
jgi:serine/threonine protein kinase